MVYLRLAEALNRAGYPRFAFQILARGVNNDVIGEYVLPYCHTASDSAFVSQFNFPFTANTGYIVRDITSNTPYNTIADADGPSLILTISSPRPVWPVTR